MDIGQRVTWRLGSDLCTTTSRPLSLEQLKPEDNLFVGLTLGEERASSKGQLDPQEPYFMVFKNSSEIQFPQG